MQGAEERYTDLSHLLLPAFVLSPTDKQGNLNFDSSQLKLSLDTKK